MDAELEFAIQPNTTGKQLFDQVGGIILLQILIIVGSPKSVQFILAECITFIGICQLDFEKSCVQLKIMSYGW